MSRERRILTVLAAALARNPGATTSELAAASGISRATLNRRFSSRDAIVRDVLLFALDACAEILEQDNTLRKLVDALCVRAPELAVLLHLESAIDADPIARAKAEQLLSRLHARVQDARRSRRLRRDVPARWQGRILADLIWSGWAAIQAGEIGAKECGDLVWRSWIEGQQPTRES